MRSAPCSRKPCTIASKQQRAPGRPWIGAGGRGGGRTNSVSNNLAQAFYGVRDPPPASLGSGGAP